MNINVVWLIIIIVVVIFIINDKESTKMTNKKTIKILYPHKMMDSDEWIQKLYKRDQRDISMYLDDNFVSGYENGSVSHQASVNDSYNIHDMNTKGRIIEHTADIADAYSGNDVDTISMDGYTSTSTSASTATSSTSTTSGVLVDDTSYTYDDTSDTTTYDPDIDITLGPYSVVYGSTDPKFYTRSCRHDKMISGPFEGYGEAMCQDECTETDGCNYATLDSDKVCRLFARCKGERTERGGKTWIKN
jgi:hypothetical protein